MTRRARKGMGFMDDQSDMKVYKRIWTRKWFQSRHSGFRMAVDLPGPGVREFTELLCLNTTKSST